MGIEAANHSPIEKKFNLGVIQVKRIYNLLY